MKKIAIIGLGYVGLPLAVTFGMKRDVIGFDINQERIKELSVFLDRTEECTSEQLKMAKYLKFTSDVKEIEVANIFIITVPTPIDEVNRPDFRPLISASNIIGKIIKKEDIVIYESTVYPGATEEICVPILEKNSGLKYNSDFYVGYSPERINPGDKVNTLETIKKVVSGSNSSTLDEIDELYKSIIKAGTWRASSIKVAEASKVIENSQRDLNIAFVNELSIIFNKLNIDTIEVLEAAGSKWNFLPFRPGLVGGHCIGVDPYYLTHKSEQIGYKPRVLLAGRALNDGMASYAAVEIIRKMVKLKKNINEINVGVLGVTFKENCPDIRNTKIVDILREFDKWGVNYVVEDSNADQEDFMDEYGIQLTTINKNSLDVLVVAVGHTKYRNFSKFDLLDYYKKDVQPVLADLKSIYSKKEMEENGIELFRL